jgi:hypothetical protein
MKMAGNLRLALDPSLLGRQVDLELDAWQADLMRKAAVHGLRAIILASRQVGKSTAAVLCALWAALFDPGLILLVAPALRQSQENFRKFMELYHRLDDAPVMIAESALRCELSNGSRIVSLPGTGRTIRGFSSARLLVLDEAARIEPELIQATMPMLAISGGSMIAMSTPFGSSGWFHDTWFDSTQDWTRIKVTAAECPRLTAETLAKEQARLGSVGFSEEYGLTFHDDSTALFPSHLIERAFTRDVVPLWQ